jgi:hypothetical protein
MTYYSELLSAAFDVLSGPCKSEVLALRPTIGESQSGTNGDGFRSVFPKNGHLPENAK